MIPHHRRWVWRTVGADFAVYEDVAQGPQRRAMEEVLMPVFRAVVVAVGLAINFSVDDETKTG